MKQADAPGATAKKNQGKKDSEDKFLENG